MIQLVYFESDVQKCAFKYNVRVQSCCFKSKVGSTKNRVTLSGIQCDPCTVKDVGDSCNSTSIPKTTALKMCVCPALTVVDHPFRPAWWLEKADD